VDGQTFRYLKTFFSWNLLYLGMVDPISFEGRIQFIGNINAEKDCLMSQDETPDSPSLWFNIDVPKGHGIYEGDLVRVTVEKVE